jgi:hypothetical protein
MEPSFTRLADGVVAAIGPIRDGAPATMKAFGSLAVAATAPNALDTEPRN